MRCRVLALVLISVLLSTGSLWAASPPDTETLPPVLDSWKGWVLYGKEDRFCPPLYNRKGKHQCAWPSRLSLDLDEKGGRFAQQWSVFNKRWVPLPGGPAMWPQLVKVDGASVAVVPRGKVPFVHLLAGEHTLEGRFLWTQLPEMIPIPETTALVSLTLNGKHMKFPMQDNRGRLWLQKPKAVLSDKKQVRVRVYRLLIDTVPMKVDSHLKIDVSGQPREIRLGGILLKDTIPMQIKGPLPSRLGAGGVLVIQARPGRWEMTVRERFAGPVQELGPVKPPFGREIWAFRSQNHLRMVKVTGVPSIDPNQTDMPSQWRRFPTYVVKSGDQIRFKEIRRGDPDPAPDQLHLKRTWWLDFNGKALTIQDRINGTMSRHWHLAMNPPAILGRVSVDGKDQLITGQGKEKKPGVQLRRGRLNLVGESRFQAGVSRIPAVGWDHDFQSVSGSLNLPPGWRLLTASGVDVMPGTWFQRWTLLDLFLVLIISLAVFKLWNVYWGILALFAVGLTFHEPGSPRLVWLHLLAASALVRFLPAGWFRRLINLWRLGALVALIALAVPFMVQQVRWGVFPQLERPGAGAWPVERYRMGSTMDLPQEAAKPKAVERRKKTLLKRRPRKPYQALQKPMDRYGRSAVLVQDPNAQIQTGPGLPTWKWRTYAMKWNGPVNADQHIRLWLLGPRANLGLALIRVLLLAFLIYGLTGFRRWKMPDKTRTAAALAAFMLLIPAAARAATEERQSAFPPSELLKQLEERLLKPPDCLPNCAVSPAMSIHTGSNSLRIQFQVHAAAETAVPLPGSLASWQPQVVLLDSEPAKRLARDRDGLLWMVVPKGVHTVNLMGSTPPGNAFQVPLPLRPLRVTVQGDGWKVQGVDRQSRVQGSIKLIRLKGNASREPRESHMVLPPFLHVNRVFFLGLEWQVRTRVRRVTPVGIPVAVSIPLVNGESVTTEGIRVEEGKALIHLAPGEKEVRWTSTLKASPVIRLQAPRNVPWTETWTLDASPIWQCQLSGIPVVHHQDRSGHWRPQWKPWPGEGITISISRPKAIPGALLTIDRAKMTVTPGKRFDKVELWLNIRSSQGGQHMIVLPEKAKLQSVKVRGKSQPIKGERREVVVPLRPGAQSVNVLWHQGAHSSLISRAPKVDVGHEAVNVDVVFHMPGNRWILLAGGPPLGPAVLFWSYLFVIVLAAVALGRLSWTPLKTRHWLLLGLGLTQVHPLVGIMIVGWLLALGFRKDRPIGEGWFRFDLAQILIVVWTVGALIGLYMAVQKGLLGIPNMQISGNGSTDFYLRWTQDRVGTILSQPWVFSLPLLLFRILMLLWALWLAHSLLKWLRWGWQCFGEAGLWRGIRLRKAKPDEPSVPPPLPPEGAS